MTNTHKPNNRDFKNELFKYLNEQSFSNAEYAALLIQAKRIALEREEDEIVHTAFHFKLLDDNSPIPRQFKRVASAPRG